MQALRLAKYAAAKSKKPPVKAGGFFVVRRAIEFTRQAASTYSAAPLPGPRVPPYFPLAGLIRYCCITDSDTEAQVFWSWRKRIHGS